MVKWLVHEYGEPKAEGRTAIVEANSKEEAIKQSPFQEWGTTAILKADESYFISKYFNKKKEILIPQEVEQEIYDIIRDESQDKFNPTRRINEEDIQSSVSFIMSLIADVIIDERYLIKPFDSTLLTQSSAEGSLISVKRDSAESSNPPANDERKKEVDFV